MIFEGILEIGQIFSCRTGAIWLWTLVTLPLNNTKKGRVSTICSIAVKRFDDLGIVRQGQMYQCVLYKNAVFIPSYCTYVLLPSVILPAPPRNNERKKRMPELQMSELPHQFIWNVFLSLITSRQSSLLMSSCVGRRKRRSSRSQGRDM